MELEELTVEVKEIYAFVGAEYKERDGDEVTKRLMHLSTYLARSAKLLSYAQYFLDQAKGNASEKILEKLGDKLAPTIVKTLVEKESALENRVYKACERLNRTITHQIDALRSQLSYLKSLE